MIRRRCRLTVRHYRLSRLRLLLQLRFHQLLQQLSLTNQGRLRRLLNLNHLSYLHTRQHLRHLRCIKYVIH